jgi:hypothetical protein
VFRHCDLLHPYVDRVEEIFANWKSYKQKVPVYGAILLNPEMTQARRNTLVSLSLSRLLVC